MSVPVRCGTQGNRRAFALAMSNSNPDRNLMPRKGMPETKLSKPVFCARYLEQFVE